MATIKDKNKDGMSIFIAFHVNNELNQNKDAVSLKNSMREIFGSSQTLEIEGEENLKKEFIYRITKPLLISDVSMSEFFEKLKKAFNVNSSLNPHFTQVGSEVTKGKK